MSVDLFISAQHYLLGTHITNTDRRMNGRPTADSAVPYLNRIGTKHRGRVNFTARRKREGTKGAFGSRRSRIIAHPEGVRESRPELEAHRSLEISVRNLHIEFAAMQSSAADIL